MGYISGLTNSSFKKLNDDRFIFFPYGIIGYGYIVSKEEKENIASFLCKYYLIIFTGIVLLFLLSFIIKLYLLFSFLLLTIWYSVKVNKIIRHKEVVTKEKLTKRMRSSIKNMGQSMGKFISCLLFLGSLSLLIPSLWLLIRRNIAGIVGVLFFGLTSFFTLFLVIYSFKK